MTSSLTQAMRAENEIVIAMYNAIEDAESFFNDDVVSYETLDDSAVFTVVA
jgi:hypothetical protein